MKINPRISIITVCYNSGTTIEETILSVISQDYENYEYFIIDGGSTDETLNIVGKYKDNISVVVSEPDKGISDAFNKGILLASGDVIGLINSDDLLAKGALNTLAASYSPEVDVYRGNMIIEDGESGKIYQSRPTMFFSKTSRISNVCHPSTFVKKEAYQKWGSYRIEFKYMMDVDLLYRFYFSGAKFKYIDASLAVFRTGGRTADAWSEKLGEYKQMLLFNNFPKWLIIVRIACFVVYNVIKQWCFKVFGVHYLRSIKYGCC